MAAAVVEPMEGRQGHYAGAVSRLVAFGADVGASWGLFTLGAAALAFTIQLASGTKFSLTNHQLASLIAAVIWEFLYFAYQWTLSGKTIGMAILGIRVVKTDGAPIGARSAVIRTVTLPLSIIVFGLGFLGILTNRHRYAWHDRFARPRWSTPGMPGRPACAGWPGRTPPLRRHPDARIAGGVPDGRVCEGVHREDVDLGSCVRHGRRKPLGGLPTGVRVGVSGLFGREAEIVAPGAVLLPGWLDTDAQRALAEACRRWGVEAGGFRAPRMPRGGVMSVQIACLGWHWYPYRYSRYVDDGDGRPVLPFPDRLGALSRRAVHEARRLEPSIDAVLEASPETVTNGFRPDVALINWYAPGAHMGMHVDRDEQSPAPVVSFSVGDSCVFRFGTPAGRGRPWTDVLLESGDVFVFGGPSRLAYHGVPRIIPASGNPLAGVGDGRFNITVRQSGLVDVP